MTLLQTDLDFPVEQTSADRAAEANWAANLAALHRNQPGVLNELDQTDSPVEWLWACDGFLSARHGGGGWWSGCSIPQAAALAMLRNLELIGTVSAFLAPAHAAQIRTALDLASPQQAIIVLQPDAAALNIDLHCCDFSTDIAAHRLWFASGLQWADQLIALLRQHSGLPSPTQFIRTPATPSELTDRMIVAVEPMIDAEQQRRAAALAALGATAFANTPSPAGASPLAASQTSNHGVPICQAASGKAAQVPAQAGLPLAASQTTNHGFPICQAASGKVAQAPAQAETSGYHRPATLARPICIVAASRFRLWDDAGASLARIMASDAGGEPCLRLDPDDPSCTSALHVATTAASARALVTANTPRTALPDVIGAHMPVIVWLTSPQVPPYDAAYPHDGLLLADAAWKPLAQKCGWPAERLEIAAWPLVDEPVDTKAQPAPGECSAMACGISPSPGTPAEEWGEGSHARAGDSQGRSHGCEPSLLPSPGGPGAGENATCNGPRGEWASTSAVSPKHPTGMDSARPIATSRTRWLALIADTSPLDVPFKQLDLSSRHVLWELIRDELLSRPFALTGDVGRYLAARRQRLQISEEGFDAALFVTRLILPAYQQGLARCLLRDGIALRLFGRGWDACDAHATAAKHDAARAIELARFWGGPVTCPQQLLATCASSAGLVHCWPGVGAHPMEAFGRPVLRRSSDHLAAFLHDARFILGGGGKPAQPTGTALRRAVIERLLAR